MKTTPLSYLILFAAFTIVYSSCQQSKGDLPCIDARKNYPEKEILLTDIANVSYLHLNTENKDYLFNGRINIINKNVIVVSDWSSGTVLFFSRDGNPISRFNRVGRGPHEYLHQYGPVAAAYDEATDEVFVQSSNSLFVYSSTGEYKRTITLPTRFVGILNYDDQSLLLCDERKQYRKVGFLESDDSAPTLSDSSYFRISKADGKILEYLVVPSKDVDFTVTSRGGEIRSQIHFSRMRKCAAGILLSPPETDTIFLYSKDGTTIPIFCKTPLVSLLNPKVVLTGFMDTDSYQFMMLRTLTSVEDSDKFPDKYYIRDKQTGEIFRQKMILPDYKEKVFFIQSIGYFYEKGMFAYITLDLLELKKAYKENKLSGKLKELVATLKEDDNNVYVMVNFK